MDASSAGIGIGTCSVALSVLSGSPMLPSPVQELGPRPFRLLHSNPQFPGAGRRQRTLHPHPHLQDQTEKAVAVWGRVQLRHAGTCPVLAPVSLRQLLSTCVGEPFNHLHFDGVHLSATPETVTQTPHSRSSESLSLAVCTQPGISNNTTFVQIDGSPINVRKTRAARPRGS